MTQEAPKRKRRVIPSLQAEPLTESYTWASPVPTSCKGVPCALGVDEAGRGPVLGPMVYGVAYCPSAYQDQMKAIGFADSKALTGVARNTLLNALIDDERNIGWAVRVLSPQSISQGMLRRRPVNLNQQASNATILLISSILESGVDLTEIYVDTVGDAGTYQRLLASNFPRHKHIKWVVTSKADSIYPIVGAASIGAKVTRDACLRNWLFTEQNFGKVIKASDRKKKLETIGDEEELELDDLDAILDDQEDEAKGTGKGESCKKGKRKAKEIESEDDEEGERGWIGEEEEEESRSKSSKSLDGSIIDVKEPKDRLWALGSGYPGDPKTIQFLKDSIDPIFGYPGLVRFSWSTIKITLGISDSSDKAANPKFKNSVPARAQHKTSNPDSKTKYNALKVRWIDEAVPISNFFGTTHAQKKKAGGGLSGEASEKEKLKQKWKTEDQQLRHGRIALWRDMGLSNVGPGALDF